MNNKYRIKPIELLFNFVKPHIKYDRFSLGGAIAYEKYANRIDDFNRAFDSLEIYGYITLGFWKVAVGIILNKRIR